MSTLAVGGDGAGAFSLGALAFSAGFSSALVASANDTRKIDQSNFEFFL